MTTKKTTTKKATTKKATTKKTTSGQRAPAKKTPAKGDTTEKADAEKTPTEKSPTEKTPTEKTTAEKKKPAKAAEKKMSGLDAAAKVLGESKEPLNTRAMIEAMAAKNYWTSPGGKTPHATLYAAILREINTKGNEARFAKTDRGHFGLKSNG